MGLLDFEDPQTAGIMKLGLGLLSAGGPSRMPISVGQGIGQAGSAAMDEMQQARQMQVQNQLRNLQMQELARKMQQAQMAEAAKQKILSDPATDPRLRKYVEMGGDISKLFDPTSMAEGAKMTIPGLGMMGGNPVIAEGAPKRIPPMFKEKYVNGPNGEPHVQKEISLDNGATWANEGVSSPRFAKQIPNTNVTNIEDPNKYAPISVVRRGPDGKDDPSLGAELISRGQAIMERRTPAAMDAGIQGGLTGAKVEAKGKAERALSMAGLGGVIEEAKDILTGSSGKPLPTQSGLGTAYDAAAAFIGQTPEGANEAQRLRAIGGALTSKMPRMEGPQSDKDTQLYKEMAGLVGDSSIPRSRRIAALDVVEKLWGKYEQPAKQSSGATGVWAIREKK